MEQTAQAPSDDVRTIEERLTELVDQAAALSERFDALTARVDELAARVRTLELAIPNPIGGGL